MIPYFFTPPSIYVSLNQTFSCSSFRANICHAQLMESDKTVIYYCFRTSPGVLYLIGVTTGENSTDDYSRATRHQGYSSTPAEVSIS